MQALDGRDARPGSVVAPRFRTQHKQPSEGRSASLPPGPVWASQARGSALSDSVSTRVPPVTPKNAQPEDYFGSITPERVALASVSGTATPKRPALPRSKTHGWTRRDKSQEDTMLYAAVYLALVAPPVLAALEPKKKKPVRSATLPMPATDAHPRLPLSCPDWETWYGEAVEGVHPSLRKVPEDALERRGEALVATLDDVTLVLPKSGKPSVPTRDDLLKDFFTRGLTKKTALLEERDGELVRVLPTGAVRPPPEGLYTAAIDQSDRMIVGIMPNKNTTAKRSTRSTKASEGATGSHAELTVHLPGKWFGEVEVRGDRRHVSAYTNRSGDFMTPPCVARGVGSHPLLKDAKFYAYGAPQEDSDNDSGE